MSEGLRASRKHETRLGISEAATRLFIERGFEETTIADVAAMARVARMTVTNHFPHKEDLVFGVFGNRAEFAAWPGTVISTNPFANVRDGYFVALDERQAYVGFADPGFVRMVRNSPTLTATLREMHREREEHLAQVLTRRNPNGGIRPRTAAAHLTAVLRHLFDEVFDASAEDLPKATVARRVRVSATAAWDQLGAGLA